MMVTFLAQIHIGDNKYIDANYIESPFRCSILIDDKYYYAKTKAIRSNCIKMNETINVEIQTIYGEECISSFCPGKHFSYVVTEPFGDGEITGLLEIDLQDSKKEMTANEYFKLVNYIKSIKDDFPEVKIVW